MSWLHGVLRAGGEPLLFGQLDDAAGGQAVGGELVAGACYVSASLRIAHIEFGRRGTRRLSAVTSCSARLNSTWPGGSAQLGGLALDGALAGLDPAHRGRVMAVGTPLFGPAPYFGGPLTMEVGLFSRTDKDLAEPFLQFVGKVADLAAVPFVPMAAAFLPLVDEGLALLHGADGLELEAGVAATWTRPIPGTFVVARARGRTPAMARLEPDGLFWSSGEAVVEPHLVFDIVASDRRDDFSAIPDIAAAWTDLRDAVLRDRHDQVDEAMARLRRAAAFNPDLIPADSERLVGYAQERIVAALPGGLTSSAGANPIDFPELADVPLYPATSSAMS
ncbi:hypothetical protein [Frankia tisae]|uniref:hypothetical protein n=1 Tax=Frankia tisae TaxID=2950104 RepID=UPI0021C07A82|nr:hypothetical protein [Frankia tisae]